MKLLYIDQIIVKDYMGGSHKSLLSILAGMKNRGHQIILATPGNGVLDSTARDVGVQVTQYMLPGLIETRVTLLGKIFFNIFAALYDSLMLLIASLSLLKLILKIKPDVVHANQMLISISTGLACTLAGIPCIWHIRENPSPYVPGIIKKVYGLLGYLLSDKILVNSQYTADIFQNTSMCKKIAVVPIGIENTTDYSINKSVNSKDNRLKSTKIISIFGRVIPMKGHKVLIKAINILKEKHLDLELQIMGHFDENDQYYLSLRSLIVELGLTSYIKFCGFKSVIGPIFYSSDIIVSSSIESESFGRTIIEAMAAGKPVVTTRVGAHSELVEDGVTGYLVEPGNPEQLADRIEKLLNNDEFANQMGKLGRRRYEKYFTLKKYMDRLENLYQNLLK